MSAIPWTYQRRDDTGTTNIRVGVWLLIASEAMLFAALFASVVMLRGGADRWPDGHTWLGTPSLVAMTALVVGAAALVSARTLWWSSLAATGWLVAQGLEWVRLLDAGHHPASSVAAACWFVLTGTHAVHVAGGVAANVWCALTAGRVAPAHAAERRGALRRHWVFMVLVWLGILATMGTSGR